MNVAPRVSPRVSVRTRGVIRTAARLVATGLGVAAAGYAGLAAHSWYRYGHPRPAVNDDADALLDRFMPTCEVVERHPVRVRAPAAITLAAAREQDLIASPVIRAIFNTRALVSPGVAPSLGPLKAEAKRRARQRAAEAGCTHPAPRGDSHPVSSLSEAEP
jgi:hypothetical protein